jgi:DMSO reductase anchor subunit
MNNQEMSKGRLAFIVVGFALVWALVYASTIFPEYQSVLIKAMFVAAVVLGLSSVISMSKN